MLRNALIVAALAALLVGFGVVTGTSVLRSENESASRDEPELLSASAEPRLEGARVAPALLGEDVSPQLIQRIQSLESTIERLRLDLSKLSERLKPAAQIIAMINQRRPGQSASRAAANEVAAISTTRNVVSAQAQMQATARIDTDNDGTGEYGGFLELSGALAGRMAKPLNPPVLSRAFRLLSKNGEVTRSGYIYRIYLPDGRGAGIGEPETAFAAGDLDADLAETTWCIYAWPIEYGKTGTRTFLMNQAGDTLATDDERYSGPENGPAADAAFRTSRTITGSTAVGMQGQDGNTWKQVN